MHIFQFYREKTTTKKQKNKTYRYSKCTAAKLNLLIRCHCFFFGLSDLSKTAKKIMPCMQYDNAHVVS